MLNVWMKGCDSFLGIQDTLKALADPIRREILNLLKNGRLSAGDDGTGLVYTKGNADEGFDVCGVSYNNPTEEVFLAYGMTDVMLADDQEHILCRRYDGQSEDDQLVFLTSFEEETKELGTPVSDMYAWENGAVYYFASGENTECELEDFVIDSRGNTEQWQELQKEAESYHPVPTECQSLYEY